MSCVMPPCQLATCLPGLADPLKFRGPSEWLTRRSEDVMSDDMVGEGLIDDSGTSVRELLDDGDEASFTSALDRIFTSPPDGGRYAFSSSI